MTLNGGRVVIIGGGIIGISIAYHLGVAGYRNVAVVERNLLGEGTTAYATGGIRCQFSSRVNIELVQQSVDFWENFEAYTGRPLDFRKHGYLFLISDEITSVAFGKNAALQRSLGVDVEILDPAQIRTIFPGVRTDDLLSGTYTPNDGSAWPADAVAGYAHAARRNGVLVMQNTRVLDIVVGSEGTVSGVQTSEGDIAAEVVVIAAGPQSRAVGALCGLDIPVFPHSRQAFAAGPVPSINGNLPLTVDMATGAYLHPLKTGGAIIGGNDRHVPSTEEARVDSGQAQGLAAALWHRFPDLAELKITAGWAGLREMTPDGLAIIGPAGEVGGLYIAAGFSGHGFMQSPAVGNSVAQLLLYGHPDLDLSPLSITRFEAPLVGEVENAVF
ncbi:NAD(P)/FAD-dependent oxidoreductase [Mycobacterium haemophilum]|uniref:FAD-dependent oxidoreductase n=1 Tax=Mycobacterium haemophilum TaxID=29311 RepID=A0A0I9XLN5_9MYCO|nr:FAD-binding oxidoreductase [Mycobacterium haemophilum]AKN17450.1 FAD-dependent oxidoreductase [Mycobacterium haemophilum DSM 44634]KLO27767.1 FAD-dependent oxidoreductase [Mycobacterium haemophilum]KLO35274.1 FAD-dependent oxidoreductase [Mycobacterium haemophilum]KLO40286.1 FAD-dependent oxidoreductase [Mycobacterium haemophilum]KLO47560.1 FAD-dependent oxidoreductase [Mycobacterium haemophilum]